MPYIAADIATDSAQMCLPFALPIRKFTENSIHKENQIKSPTKHVVFTEDLAYNRIAGHL